jgi:hypothetical protein
MRPPPLSADKPLFVDGATRSGQGFLADFQWGGNLLVLHVPIRFRASKGDRGSRRIGKA